MKAGSNPPLVKAFAVRCRLADVLSLRASLNSMADLAVMALSDFSAKVSPPDLVFVAWGGGYEDARDSDEDRRIRNAAATAMILSRIRAQFAFRDVPLLLLADSEDIRDASAATRYGACGVLSCPLEPDVVRKTVEEAMKPVGEQTRIDVRLVNPFVEATINVIKAMAHMNPVRREVLLKKDYRLFGEVSAVIGMTGQGVDGAVALTFQEDLAREIVSRMWNKPPRDLSAEEINDGLGELVNVVSGNAAAELSKAGTFPTNLSVPTIVGGLGHEIVHPAGTPCLAIVFEVERHAFAVQVAIRTNLNS